MSAEAKRAYVSFAMQRQRCYNPKNNRFHYYGRKGIRVEYGVREFIGWWLAQFKRKKWKHPQCGRIDHEKNYSINNIEMIERSDNLKEMNTRKSPWKHDRILALIAPNFCLYFANVAEASRILDVPASLIRAALDGTLDSPIPKIEFRYGSDK